MKLKLFSITCILLFLLTGAVFSAVTGKITGVITDAANEQPLVGVTVSVQGTSWGAITDTDGRYIILNLPVNAYVITISAVGYSTLEVSNVEVHGDLATYQSHALTSAVTELGTVISVTAEAPLVVRDKTTSITIVKAEQIVALPTRGFEQIVGLQNSVVRMNSNTDIAQRGGAAYKGTGSSVNIRGGRPKEVAYYIDGFSQQDPLTGLSTANISNNAIQEISIQSGAFSAEYGHVASGIINVITKSGSDSYHVEVEMVTDNFLSGSKKVYDNNFYTADLGGPIPGLNNSYFYASGERRYLQDRAPSPKTEEFFLANGISGADGNMLPNNSLSGWSWQGKMDFNLTPNFKFTANGNGSLDYFQRYQQNYNNLDQPGQIDHAPRAEDINWGVNGKITHTLNANNFYNLSVSYFYTERFVGDGVLMRDYEAYEFLTGNNPESDVHNLYLEGDIIENVDGDSIGVQPHIYDDYLIRKSSYLGFKGDYTSQRGASNTVKIGFDFQRHTLRRFRDLTPTLGFTNNGINRYGMDSVGNDSDDQGFKNSTKNPINLGIYIQNRFDWRGLIVNAGIRYDYFDYKAGRIKNPARPFDPDNLDPSDSKIDEVDLIDSEKFVRISPRLGVSFPISEKTQMHINYGKFFQRPNLQNLYVGYDFYETRVTAGSFFPFASPNLEPEKVTQYEFGFTHQLNDVTAVDFTAYYKDVQDLTAILHISPAIPSVYDVYSNIDFGTIKGVDLSLTMRRSRNISLDLKYSLSYATGTGSYTSSTRNIAWKNTQGFPTTTNPLDYDRRHSIIGNLDYRTGKGEGPEIGGFKPLENFGFNILLQTGSGTPYTPTAVYDAIGIRSVDQNPTGSINSSNLPWSFSVDLKIDRIFTVSNYKFVPYVWVKNLFDYENIGSVYEGTGEADVTGYLRTLEGQDRAAHTVTGEDFVSKYSANQANPKNYYNPRMIFAGLRVSF